MTDPASDQIFAFAKTGTPLVSYGRTTGSSLQFREDWLQRAVFENPELVMGACRAAGLSDESWYPLAREFRTDAGSIDVLLVSDTGRVAIVETKMASNAEGRRRVLQVLDYMTALEAALLDGLPGLPDELIDFGLHEDDVVDAVRRSDVLIVIAGDRNHPRAVRLSKALLDDHIMRPWDLALVDVALYMSSDPRGEPRVLAVPLLVGAVRAEVRQVIRVIVEAPDVRAVAEPHEAEPEGRPAASFLSQMSASQAPGEAIALAKHFDELSVRYRDVVAVTRGRGKKWPSLLLRVEERNLLELYVDGVAKWRRDQIRLAVGERLGGAHIERMAAIFPRADHMAYPRVASTELALHVNEVMRALDHTLEEHVRAAGS